ncbi:MAG: ABC transporter permease [Bacteroidales bacterium]|nr:ABC transporter permease [Bacteroidales bacterium]MCF8386505.1 ABC transporter permease [Bacteroidales bacterium]MCF8397091.1 ABC transporter permease [Bacteroidales bacterium]
MTYSNLIWKMNRGFTLFSMLFISLFQLMILYLVTTFDTQAMLKSVLSQLPENLKLFLNDAFFNMLTFDGAAAFGFNHPIVLSLLAIVAISIPVRHVSREIENGNMEMMLSQPFRRKSLILKLWLSACLILGLIILTSFLASILSIQIFHELSWKVFFRILTIALNLWLLFILIMTFTLLIATLSKGGGFSGNLGAVITLLFYLLFFFGQLWKEMKFTLHINIFNYYMPQEIMMGQNGYWLDCTVLAGLILILLLLSLDRFEKRDIP